MEADNSVIKLLIRSETTISKYGKRYSMHPSLIHLIFTVLRRTAQCQTKKWFGDLSVEKATSSLLCRVGQLFFF